MASTEEAKECFDAKEKVETKKRRIVHPWDEIPPVGSATLTSLKKYVYVDKTNLLGRVMAHQETYILAPSMRRCGKSLTVLLLRAMAEGNRDALQGMDICGDNPTWELPHGGQYQVISLDFSLVDVSDATGAAEVRIARFLRQLSEFAGITISESYCSTPEILSNWIEQLAKGRDDSVVVLMDEYDALLTPFLTDPEKLEANSAALRSIFVTLKALNTRLFKVFVTGGLKAGMSGLFSGSNNFYRLLDEDPEYSTLFGFTKDEVRLTYGTQISQIFPDASLDESIQVMEGYYNGYRVHPNQVVTLFNPYSFVSYLRGRKLRRYWALTCTSSQLDEMLLRHGTEALNGCQITWESLQQPVGENAYINDWKSLLFQSGYLTIVEAVGDKVSLGPPNSEVTDYLMNEIPRLIEKKAVSRGLLPNITDYSRYLSTFRFEEAADTLTKVLRSLEYSLLNESEFAGWALHLLRLFETHYEYVFTEISQRIYTVRKGANTKRFDGALVVKNNDVYSAVIVVLKFDKTAREAYAQTTDRNYVARCEKFLKDKLDISVAKENWYSVGFNLTNAPTKLVTYCDKSVGEDLNA